MTGIYTSVNNVDSGSGACRGVIDVGGGVLVSMGDAAKTPCCTRLRGESRGVDLGILLNVCNLK